MRAFLALFAIPALAASAAAGYAVHAAAEEMQQETRVAAGFRRIEISGQVIVTLVQGDGEGITIEAPAASLPLVRTEVHGETLQVEVTEGHSIWRWFSGRSAGRTPHVTVRLRELDRLEAAGAVTVIADSLRSNSLFLDLAGACTLNLGDLQASTLRLDGSGAIKIDIGGKVARQKIDLSGASSYQAEHLVSGDAVVDVSGAGKAVVNASNSLAVDISGAGKLEYLGNPQLKQSISGIGKITRR